MEHDKTNMVLTQTNPDDPATANHAFNVLQLNPFPNYNARYVLAGFPVFAIFEL